MKEEVNKKILELIGNKAGNVAIQGGHFALVHDCKTDKLIPGIWQDIEDIEQCQAVKDQPYMGDFPVETFSLAAHIAKQFEDRAKIVLLANDWQWVKPVKAGEEHLDRLNFYRHVTVPKSYQEILLGNNLADSVLMSFEMLNGEPLHEFIFAESKLRNQYSRNNRFNVSCPLNNSCAQEFVPLIDQLYRRDIRIVINMVPVTCREAIETSSKAMASSGEYHDLLLINIYPEYGRETFWTDADLRVHEL